MSNSVYIVPSNKRTYIFVNFITFLQYGYDVFIRKNKKNVIVYTSNRTMSLACCHIVLKCVWLLYKADNFEMRYCTFIIIIQRYIQVQVAKI